MGEAVHALTLIADPTRTLKTHRQRREMARIWAVSASLEMQNQGSSHELVRYPEPMQRVALLT